MARHHLLRSLTYRDAAKDCSACGFPPGACRSNATGGTNAPVRPESATVTLRRLNKIMEIAWRHRELLALSTRQD